MAVSKKLCFYVTHIIIVNDGHLRSKIMVNNCCYLSKLTANNLKKIQIRETSRKLNL